MTVSDLINQLQTCDPHKEVIFHVHEGVPCLSEKCDFTTVWIEDYKIALVQERINQVVLQA